MVKQYERRLKEREGKKNFSYLEMSGSNWVGSQITLTLGLT